MCLLRIRSPKRRMLFIIWTAGVALLALSCETAAAWLPGTGPTQKTIDILKQIHAEVKELGPYPGEDLIRREFFVGEDDDDTNKDIHVIVLIQALNSEELMTVRVTEMTKDPGNPRARLAGKSRMLSCRVAPGRLEVLSSDYKEKDLAELAPGILTAIQNKKKILKLSPCGSGRPG